MAFEGLTDREALVAAVKRGYRPRLLFFWGHKSDGQAIGKQCLSQWWPAPFVIDGHRYASAEHFMMAEKARAFDDQDNLQRILTAANPSAAKRFGREVRGFDERRWAEVRFDIVVKGNRAKFRQNVSLAEFLAGTGDRVLVEASPVDRIWGIGLAENDPAAADPARWRGLNLLGFALMQVRQELRSEAV